MKIEFSDEQLVALYRTGGDEARKAIKEALGDEFSKTIPVTSRVQTFDDAVRELGDDHPAVKAWRSLKYGYAVSDTDPETADIMAYATLRVITEALNEGWKPLFTEGERRWYAWYDFLTKEEVEEMSDEEKKERRVVGRASMRLRVAASFTRTRAAFLRSRARTAALGSPSRMRNWQNMPPSSLATSTPISASFPKQPARMKKPENKQAILGKVKGQIVALDRTGIYGLNALSGAVRTKKSIII